MIFSWLGGEETIECMFLSCHVRVWEWIHTLQLPECQGTPCSKQARNLKVKWLSLDSNPEFFEHSHSNWPRMFELEYFLYSATVCSCRVWIHSQTRTWHDKNIQFKCTCTDKYSEHSSIIWPVWSNGWVFV